MEGQKKLMLKMRYCFLGRFRTQNILKALAIAKICKDPEAIFINEIFSKSEDKNVINVLKKYPNNEIAVTYLYCLHVYTDVSILKKFSFPFAKYLYKNFYSKNYIQTLEYCSNFLEFEAIFDLSNIKHRMGMFDESQKLFIQAIKLGSKRGLKSYAITNCKENTIERWKSIKMYYKHIEKYIYDHDDIIEELYKLETNLKEGPILYYISKFVVDYKLFVDHQSLQYFENFYNLQIVSTINSINTWSMIGKRLGVCKDIRIYIGKLIYETRKEGLFFSVDN